MKKLLLSILSVIAISGAANAQVQCDEDLINANSAIQFGAFPDTTTNFAPAFADTTYEQYLHFRIPTDAGSVVPQYAGATINHFTVTDVTGLPGTGVFQYECSVTLPNPCRFEGGTWGCAKIVAANNIPASLIGTHNITIAVQGNVSLMPNVPGINVPYSFSGYRLKIYPHDQLGTTLAEYDFATIYPNPATSEIYLNNLEEVQVVKIVNLSGQEVKVITPIATQMTIDVTDLTAGTYMVYSFGANSANIQKLIKK